MHFRTQAATAAAILSLLFTAFMAPASAQVPQTAPTASAPANRTPAPGEPAGSGPYMAVMEADPSLPTHTVYRPADLNAIGNQKLPIVLWANGACANTGNRFQFFLTDIASYGYLVIAIGPIVPGGEQLGAAPAAPPPGAPAAAPAAPPQIPQGHAVPTHTSQLFDALNWALAEAARPESKFHGKLATDRIAVMGQSCGGVQAIEAAADPRVSTVVIWDSGLFPTPSGMGGGKTMTKDDLKLIHTPIAYIGGDKQDVSFPNANDDFDKINNVPIFRGWERGIPHIGTYRQPYGGEFSGVAIAWLNWQLKGDQHAALMFKGQDCGLCVNPKWVVAKKKID